MHLTAQQLATLIDGRIEGDPNTPIHGPSGIESAEKGTVTFLSNPKYEAYVYKTQASVVLVPDDFDPDQPLSCTLIRVPDVYSAVRQLLMHFDTGAGRRSGISSSASIHHTAIIGTDVYVGDFSVLDEGATVGDQTQIFPQVYIGPHARIGSDCTIYPGVRIYGHCVIGDRCTIQANAVVGSAGFGFARDNEGAYQKIPQLGNVVLEDDVDIGANTVIDRATMASTVIRQGAKLDNLIQIAHNVEVGQHTVMAAQVGISGSTKIGNHCQMGGQVGLAGHLSIADQTTLMAQSGVISSIDDASNVLCGSPAIPYKEYFRSFAALRRLPDLIKRVRQLEKAMDNMNSE